jgi:hypothetical protein
MRAVSPERETDIPNKFHAAPSEARSFCISVQFADLLVGGILGTVGFIVLFFRDSTVGTAVAIKKIQIKMPSIFLFICFLPPEKYGYRTIISYLDINVMLGIIIKEKRERDLILFRFFHHQGGFYGTRLIDELRGHVTDKSYGLHPAT